MGILDAPGITANSAAKRDRMARVLAAIRSAQNRPGLGGSVPVTSDVPTLVHGTVDTVTTSTATNITGGERNGTRWTPLGMAGMSWNTSNGYLQNTVNGTAASTQCIGFLLIGTEVEITWRASVAGELQWIWVDGKPITTDPTAPSGLTVTANGVFKTKLTFATPGTRKIEFFMTFGQFRWMNVPNATSAVTALPTRAAKFFALGDSYLGGSALIPVLQTWGRRIAFASGMECYQGGQGGSGYTKAGAAGNTALTDSSRLAPVAEVDPDITVIFMGGNDSDVTPVSSVGTAAASVFSTLAASNPKMPVIVVGTYPNDSSSTSGAMNAGRAAVNKVIRDAALAAPNVIGFIDPIGNADIGTVPNNLANGTAYAVGDRYQFQGAIYRVITAHTGALTPALDKVEALTWLTGTGNQGTPTGNGNRDVLLSSDLTHWTFLGAGVQAQKIMAGMEKILVSKLQP